MVRHVFCLCVFTVGFMCAVLWRPAFGASGQSTVITLTFPFGARSYAMGEVGTALADDESVLFFNPAGLSVPNKRLQGGAGTMFYEPLLPAFRLKELWLGALSATYQDTAHEWSALGIFFNYLNMSVNEWFDDLTQSLDSARSWEGVFALGWGFNFKEFGVKNHYFGITAKYVVSALAPGYNGAGTGRTVAFDLGYLWTIGNNFRFGATLMNMGPAIYYIDEDEKDPIPFTLNLAGAYKNDFMVNEEWPVSVAAELRLDREIVRNDSNMHPDPFYKAFWTDFLHNTDESASTQIQRINGHLGGEITGLNTVSLRSGFLIDVIGCRYEYHLGIGIQVLNHLSLDLGYICAPEGFMKGFSRFLAGQQQIGSTGARHGQWQISLSAFRLLDWSDDDYEWWRPER
ncbi:MAG: PorV/PorQ family protein [Chitinispirillaceae bacterium]|nr:PorV/PorQ family protein [Chitinispirillaceae bacterium]